MTAPTPPLFQSQLSVPVQANNFLALQSAKIAVSNAGVSGSQSVTFTVPTGTLRVTFKITNSGNKGCYIASGVGSATAVVSTTTPAPASGTGAVSNCDFVGASAIITQDFLPGTNTIAAICDASDTTTLEISIGYGQ